MHDLGRYAKKNHIEIKTRYVSLLAVGSTALVGIVFALGVVIGSKQAKLPTCPSVDPFEQLDKQGKKGTLKVESPPSVALSFHKTLRPPPAKPDVVPSPVAAPQDAQAIEPVVSAVRPPSVPRAVQLEQPIPEEVDTATPGTFSLQVGSFATAEEASAMIHGLRQSGHLAFLVKVNMPERGGDWFRVRVGPFQSKSEAWAYKLRFERSERLPAFIVKRKMTRGA